MAYVNEYEVRNFRTMFDPARFPNLAHGAWILVNLMNWTNDGRSDGWVYWPKPRNAADRLIGTLRDATAAHRNGTLTDDYSTEWMTGCYKPIKAFLTRQGEDSSAVGL